MIENQIVTSRQTVYINNEQLAVKALKGDPYAKEQLIRQNTRFIRSLINKYKNNTYSDEDLFQDAVVGMLVSISSYDPKISKFLTHARHHIKAEVLYQLSRHTSAFHSTLTFKNKVRKYNRLIKILPLKDYTEEQLMPYGLTTTDIYNIELYNHRTCGSLDEMFENGMSPYSVKTLINIYSPEDIVISSEIKSLIETELQKRLNPFEKTILCKKYGIDTVQMNLTKIATEFGVSKQYISKIHVKALLKLRCEKLKELLI